MNRWIIAALVAVFVIGGGRIMYNQTRGLRNNNPGNIRHGQKWQGMAPQQTDSEFVQFVSPEYGIRAMARILINYQRSYGLNTLRQFIYRWAPPTENLTDAYVASASRYTGIKPDEPLEVERELTRIIPGIIRHENGMQPYSEEIIRNGVAMAM
jgi:hypothetical protein